MIAPDDGWGLGCIGWGVDWVRGFRLRERCGLRALRAGLGCVAMLWCVGWGGNGGVAQVAEPQDAGVPEPAVRGGVVGEAPPATAGVVVGDAVVERFLREFVAASEANDADRKAAFYAEAMDRYFLKTHVTREFVYRDVLDWLSKGRRITRFRLTLLSAAGAGEERTLMVLKEAEWIKGGEKLALANRSQFVLRRIGGVWLIVSERDFRPGV